MIVYTTENTPVTLTITNVPDTYKLSNDGIQIEWTIVDDYILLPKFTFTFIENTLDFLAAIGTITKKSHQFTLSFKDYSFTGYIEPQVFENANTGFEEKISLNGVLDLEYLDDYEVDYGGEGVFDLYNTLTTNVIAHSSITSVTPQLAFNIAGTLGYCTSENLYDDDSQLWGVRKYVLEICKTYDLIAVIYKSSSNLLLYSKAILYTLGGDDYSAVKHCGIDETIKINELIEDYTIRVSNYDRNLDLTPDMQTKHFTIEEPLSIDIKGKLNDGGLFHSSNKWWTYERVCGYYTANDFGGWTFPKYTADSTTATEIEAWDDPSQIFDGQYPLRGAYPISWRYKTAPDRTFSEIFDATLIKTIGDSGASTMYPLSGTIIPMRYEGNINVPNGSALLIKYMYGFCLIPTRCGTANNNNINVQYGRPLVMHVTGGSGDDDTTNEWGKCPVFMEEGQDVYYSTPGIYTPTLINWRVKFRDEYWNGTGWQSTSTTFTVPMSNKFAQVKAITSWNNIVNYPTSNRLTNEDGYEIPISGVGKLIIEMVTGQTNANTSYYTVYTHLLLKDLSVKFFLPEGLLDTIRSREDTIYTTLTGLPHDSYSPDLDLMLHSDDGFDQSRSQIWLDSAMTTRLDTISYSFGGFNVTEKPEYHIIRMQTEYLSNLRTIKDYLKLDDLQLTYTYNGNKLWMSGCNLNVMYENSEVSYSYNNQSFA